MIDDNKLLYKNFDIYLLVNNKKDVLDKVKNSKSSSQCITKYIIETKLMDIHDLNKYFIQLKLALDKCENNDYDYYFLDKKENLNLMFHQKMIVNKTADLIKESNKQILWGCKPRSGKTYMTGGFILNQSKNKAKYNALILTPAPTETSPQFTEDLFEKYRDLKDFNIIHLKGSNSIKNIKLKDKNIIISSKQLFQKYVDKETIKSIKDLKLNSIIFDENHFGGTTEKSKEIIKSYSSNNTVKIFLTATYNKPLKEWLVEEECQIYWDIEDEQMAKKQDIESMVEKHGDYIMLTQEEMIKEGYENEEIFNRYKNYPELHVLTTMFDSSRYETIKENIMNSKYGFSFDVLFSLNKTKKSFNYEKEVKTILRYISGSSKEKDFKKGDESLLTRIHNICKLKDSRKPFTQLWFLSPNNINEISKCLKCLILEDKILAKYNVMIINSKSDEIINNVKLEINKQEKITKEEGKEGLILLAGNMLTLGITLNLCDIVFLLNDTVSSDKVLQMMYRCMTESLKGDKKCGYVVDMNISRVLNACISYNIYKKQLNLEDKMKYLIENHLINIDEDYFVSKKLNHEKIIIKLMELWKSDPINNLKSLLKNLENDYVEFDTETQKLLNKSFINSMGEKSTLKVEMKNEDEETQDIQTGKEKIKEIEDVEITEDTEDAEITEDTEKEEKIINISFSKDVLQYVIPLTCILTIKDNNKDFIKMLSYIQENPELLEIFEEQSLIWWKQKKLLNIIKKIVSKFYDKKSNAFNISIKFKLSMQSLIDKPKELLELINECLKPKELEKKKYGEVFTPINLVNEMLDKLDEFYKKEHNNSIFENKDLKWYDPSNGMGNFPIIVYLRLMEGLKNVIKNEKK
jgi:hypothetical protein